MSDAIIVALITGAVSLVGIYFTYKANTKKIEQEFAKTTAEYQKQAAATDAMLQLKLAVVETKIEGLATEVRKHNNFAEKYPALDQKVKDIDERLKYQESLGG